MDLRKERHNLRRTWEKTRDDKFARHKVPVDPMKYKFNDEYVRDLEAMLVTERLEHQLELARMIIR